MPDDVVRASTHLIRQFIISQVDSHPSDLAAIAAKQFGISRQAVNRHLQALERDGLLLQEGNTRGATYRRPEVLVVLRVAGLEEHQAYGEFVQPALAGLPTNVQAICEYGVTEMINNVIDHSGSENVTLNIKRKPQEVLIQIIDAGVGIFRKIQQACGLEDIRTAVFELTKGKLTTDPARHTGEGVFFASRMFDHFSIWSQELFLQHHRDGRDWLLEDREQPKPGTMVTLKIHPESSHTTDRGF